MRASGTEATNERTYDRRNRQGHQRATATAGADPAGVVLDGRVLRVGRGAFEPGSVDTLPDAKGLQVGGDKKDEPLAASA